MWRLECTCYLVQLELNICNLWFCSSLTTSRPRGSIHMCRGRLNFPGSLPFLPKQCRNTPWASNTDTRWLPLSEMNILVPSLLTATPKGKKSSPGACPTFPKRRSKFPSGVKIHTTWFPRSATMIRPRLSMAIPAGYFRGTSTPSVPKFPVYWPFWL